KCLQVQDALADTVCVRDPRIPWLPPLGCADDKRELMATTTAGYRTSPNQETTAWPAGIPYIIGNEACERFSYYGMRAILFVHLVALYAAAGEAQDHANGLARYTTHLFFAGVYALPMIGAIIADRLAGKYLTILYLSLFYCLGHA